jgi:hypothetical protein
MQNTAGWEVSTIRSESGKELGGHTLAEDDEGAEEGRATNAPHTGAHEEARRVHAEDVPAEEDVRHEVQSRIDGKHPAGDLDELVDGHDPAARDVRVQSVAGHVAWQV